MALESQHSTYQSKALNFAPDVLQFIDCDDADQLHELSSAQKARLAKFISAEQVRLSRDLTRRELASIMYDFLLVLQLESALASA